MKPLITGGAGFIGPLLADRRLAKGDRAVALDDFNDSYDRAVKRGNVAAHAGNGNYRLVEGDIRDGALLQRLFKEESFDAVLHPAARAGVRPSLTQPVLYEEGKTAIFDRQPDQPGDVPVPYANVGKAQRLLGFRARVPLEEGLRRGVGRYRGNSEKLARAAEYKIRNPKSEIVES